MAAPAAPRRSTLWAPILAVAIALAGLAAGAAALRYGPLTSTGRDLIVSQASGLKLGRVGHLRIGGLRGDIWRDFTLDRLEIYDAKGVWLEARGLRVRWRAADLIDRRLHVETASAASLTVLRRPELTPRGKHRRRPVAYQIDHARLRLETLPALSIRRGLYDLAGAFDLEPDDAGRISAFASSLLHRGDFLKVEANLRSHRFLVDAAAEEAGGGALGGSLGFAADQAFALRVQAAGSAAAGGFAVSAKVGRTEPLSMKGEWKPQGGAAQGRIQLDASRLLARYQAMLGPSVMFAISGAKGADRLTKLDLTLSSDNLSLAARGEADLANRRLGPRGVWVDARIADASKIVTGVKLGPARAIGGLGGDAGHWVFSGSASADRLTLGGYGLARVSGPVRFEARNRMITLSANLQGQGGAGSGLAAALLGGRPRGVAELSFLPDGRLLLRRVSVNGAGVSVEASGERGLLGGLAFKGAATLTNLAAARAGARGVVKASWSASQSRAGNPWSVSFDASGAGFASGLAELDRLLGQAPRLRAAADIGEGKVDIGSAVLDGAAGSVSAAGTAGLNGSLALALNWRAQGPLAVGPVEIAGSARGSGALTGTLTSPRADLTAQFASIDAPSVTLTKATVRLTFAAESGGAAAGHIFVLGDSAYGPARAATAFRFVPGGLDLTGVDLAAGGVTAQGAVGLRRGEPSSADLAVDAGPGAVLLAGHAHGQVKLVGVAGAARARLELTATDASFRQSGFAVKALQLRADGPLGALPYQVKAEGPTAGGDWRIAGSGEYHQSAGVQSLSFGGAGKMRRIEFHTLTPAELRFAGPTSSARFQIALGGGRADGELDKTGDDLKVRASLSNVGLGLINQDLAGRFDASLNLAGKGPRLGGALVAHLTGAGGLDARGAMPINGVISADLGAGAVAVNAALEGAGGMKATADASVPCESSAVPFRIAISRRGPLNGRFQIAGEMKPVWDLFMGGDRSLSGKVSASGTLSGSLADPKAVGAFALDGGLFEDGQTGLKLRNVFLRATLAGAAVDVAHLDAMDSADGTVSGQGRISLEREGVSSFRLDLDHFRLIDNDIGQATASGQATINRAADGRVKLSGALTIDKGQIVAKPPTPSGVVAMDVVEIHRPEAAAEEEPLVSTPTAPIDLDVTLKAARGLFVKGRGLNVELSLDAAVKGTTNAPILTGTAQIVRGDYDFSGKRFTFDERSSVQLASQAEGIRLDLTATRIDPSLTAVIRIRGTAARPEITLTSTPVLPADEVLSQVLFGASASQLTGLEAAQLASALAGLAGGGGLDVLSGLRSFAHLDRIAFASGPTNSTVVGGKYLRDNLYLEIGGGGPEGSSAQLEWRVKRNLAIVSRLTSQGDSQLSIRWRKDF